MSATISASVKFWPEMVTVPPPLAAGAEEPLSEAWLLSTELPAQPARSTALTAAAAPARERVFIESPLLCPAPAGARVRCPRSCQGRKWPSSPNGGDVANALPGDGTTGGVGGTRCGCPDKRQDEGSHGHHEGGRGPLG